MKPALVERFGNDIRYFNTFGANSVSIAAAQAVLDVIRDEGLMQNCVDVSAYMLEGMRSMMGDHPAVGAVRAAGLFLGMEFVADPSSKAPDGATSLKVVNRLREKRILISASGLTGHVLKIRPPLPFTRGDADQFLDALSASLREIA